jgi:hypothetical protein
MCSAGQPNFLELYVNRSVSVLGDLRLRGTWLEQDQNLKSQRSQRTAAEGSEKTARGLAHPLPLNLLSMPPLNRLPGQQRHSRRYQHGCDPSAAVDSFVEEDSGGEGVADEGQGCGGGGYEAYISPGEGEEETEEGDGHEGYAEDEILVAQDSTDQGQQSAAAALGPDVPDLFHGAGEKHVSDDGGEDDYEDRTPGVKVTHDFRPFIFSSGA